LTNARRWPVFRAINAPQQCCPDTICALARRFRSDRRRDLAIAAKNPPAVHHLQA
jgi:hypothetical protein